MNLITVLVTAYNEEKYLGRCLGAVVNQDFPKDEYEILVVDNNSTDKTVEIAKSFGARVVAEKKQGNTFAVSCGMQNAKGNIIAMTDADTIVSKTWLSGIKEVFENEKIVGATGPADINTNNKLFNLFAELACELFLRFHFLIGKPHLLGFNLIVRKNALVKIGGVNEKFTMSPDVDLGLRISKVGRVVFSRKIEATTSFRRWEENPGKTIKTYVKGYLWSVWFRKPPPTAQNVVR